MNALVKSSIDGEMMPAESTVRAVGKVHPLIGGRIDCRVRAGSSVLEILTEALATRPGSVLSRDFVVHVDGDVIPEAMWGRVRLKNGATLTFTPRLGDNGTLRSVLSVVVAVAAIALAVPTGGLSLGLAGAIGISASLASALIAGGIILAGTLALNALFPTAPAASADNVNSTALNSIQGAQNQTNPFGPIPVVLGRSLQSPYFAAKPYTEISGGDQFLRMLFCIGYGPLEMDAHQIGATSVGAFNGFQMEVRQGFPDDPPITLYPGSVDEVALNITLENSDPMGVVGGAGGAWFLQTTAPNTDEISLDFTAPEGIYGLDPKTGNPMSYQVNVSARYAMFGGDGSWIQPGDGVLTFSTSPTRIGMVFPVPRGQYQVEVRKNTGNADPAKAKDTVVWTAIRSIQNLAPTSFPKPLAFVAMRVLATDQLSGAIDTYNNISTSLVKAFNGSAWIPNTPSQWPPDLFRHVLQGPANARPRSDAQIDLVNLEQWWAYCVANGFKFNQVINTTGSVYDKLCDIAAAGRAIPTFTNGLWGVDWDRPDDGIVQHFTPRNSWGFQLQRPYVQQPDGWRASFINEKNGYTQDERIVYDDGFDATNATLFEGIQFPGVTDPDLIWRHGRFQIAQARLRPEKVSISVGWEHLICTRGDRVKLTHDVILIGLGEARVKSVVGQVVTFDDVFTVLPGNTYGVEFRVADDIRSFERAVDPSVVSGEFSSLTLVGDLSLVTSGTLCAFGLTEQESAVYRVQGIAHQKDLIATLTLVDDAPAISLADQGTIPPYNPNITIPPDPLTLPPQNFVYLPAVDGIGNSVRAITILSWQANRQGKISASELQVAQGVSGNWQPLDVLPYPQFSLSVPLPFPGVWGYRVRFQFSDGTVSSWVELSNLTLLGLSAAPADVQNVRGSAYVDGTASISWDEVTDYRPIRYAVRKGDTWDSALELGTVAHPPFAAQGNGVYWVKAYAGPDTQRAYSVDALDVDIAGAALVTNVVASRDEAANGWLGVFTGTLAKSGIVIRTGGASNFLSDPDVLNNPDVLNSGGQGNGTYEIDPSRYIDAGRITPCNVIVTWQGTSQTTSDNMLTNPDILNDPDFLANGSTDLVQVFPDVSVAQNFLIGDIFALDQTTSPGNDLFVAADIFSADISFGPWLQYEPGAYIGRWYRARLELNTGDPQVEAIATQFILSVDVPDRLDTWALVGGIGTSLNQITVPAAGLVLNFASTGKNIAEVFNGGPGTDTAPLIQITNTDAQAFDFEVDSLTLAGCTIIPRLAGAPTDAPKTNISIQGW